MIPNPFDAKPWLGIPDVADTTPTIAVVGRLEAFKGVDVILDASARLRAAGVSHRLLFAGRSAGEIDGIPSGEWLARRAFQLGLDVEFTGHLSGSQLHDVYRRARVVAVPSRFESFSIVAAEAMAAGRPVVTTNQAGVAPFVERWEAGCSVPAGDPAPLADALAPFLLAPARASAFGARGRLGVVELEPAAIARRKVEAYRRAIEHFEAHGLPQQRHRSSAPANDGLYPDLARERRRHWQWTSPRH